VRRSTIPIVLLALLSFATGLGRGAITDSDEGFYAESAREMVATGDWLTPHFNYEPRFQKPALYYWFTAALYAIGGVSEFAARAGSALAGIGLVVVVAACARRWFDDETALLAGAITATNFGYFAIARLALPDLPLTFFITLSIWTAFVATLEREREPQRWLLVSAIAAALGFLTKGPIAVLIPALVIVPILLLERRTLNVRGSDLLLAAAVFLAIAMPWYVAMWFRHGSGYLEGFFVGDNLERFATTRFNDPRPWWFYVPVVAGGLLPWTALAVVWLSPVWQFVTRRRDIDSMDMRLLLWAVLPLIFFTLSVGKQPRYVLPVLPPVAVLLAGSILERTRDWRGYTGARRQPRRSSAIVFGSVLAGAFMLAVAVFLYRAQPLFNDVSDQLTLTVAVLIGVISLAPIVVSFTSAWRWGPVLVALSAALMFALLPFGVLAAPGDSAVQQVAHNVRAHHREGDSLATYGVFVRNLVFYTGLQQTDLINDEHLASWLPANRGALIVMPEDTLLRLEREHELTFARLAELRYFDEGVIKLRTILWPDAATDLQTVWLVRAP
jgi:4-amino-4-deoxy-L-arabinose transferase-like glycosyltransferase